MWRDRRPAVRPSRRHRRRSRVDGQPGTQGNGEQVERRRQGPLPASLIRRTAAGSSRCTPDRAHRNEHSHDDSGHRNRPQSQRKPSGDRGESPAIPVDRDTSAVDVDAMERCAGSTSGNPCDGHRACAPAGQTSKRQPASRQPVTKTGPRHLAGRRSGGQAADFFVDAARSTVAVAGAPRSAPDQASATPRRRPACPPAPHHRPGCHSRGATARAGHSKKS